MNLEIKLIKLTDLAKKLVNYNKFHLIVKMIKRSLIKILTIKDNNFQNKVLNSSNKREIKYLFSWYLQINKTKENNRNLKNLKYQNLKRKCKQD